MVCMASRMSMHAWAATEACRFHLHTPYSINNCLVRGTSIRRDMYLNKHTCIRVRHRLVRPRTDPQEVAGRRRMRICACARTHTSNSYSIIEVRVTSMRQGICMNQRTCIIALLTMTRPKTDPQDTRREHVDGNTQSLFLRAPDMNP